MGKHELFCTKLLLQTPKYPERIDTDSEFTTNRAMCVEGLDDVEADRK